MRLTELKENLLSEAVVDRLLFGGLEYRGQSGDLVMVPGSRKACEYRVPFAHEIFGQTRAEKYLFCGGRVQMTKFGEMPEYQSMLRAADELGIGRENILTETESMTTEENFLLSEPILGRVEGCGRIVLVTTAYHMRRAVLLARAILPQYTFVTAPADFGSTRRSNWMLTDKGRRTAKEECMKLAYYANIGKIENIDI